MSKMISWVVVFLVLPGYFIFYPHYNDQQRRLWGPSCSIAVRQELNKNYSETYREAENDIRRCENEILDEQKNYPVRPFVFGVTKANRELIKNYAAAARLYAKKIEEGDLGTLVLLDWARPDTNRDEYTKLYYKHYGVVDLSDGQFPVELFDNSKVSLPARHHHIPAIYWLDDDNLIYRIDVGENHSEASYQEQIISVNVNTLEMKKNHTEDDLSNSSYYRYQVTYDWEVKGPLNGCLKLIDKDGHVCWPKLDLKNQKNKANTSQVELVRENGSKKTIALTRPIDIEEMGFDPFSNTYWMQRDERVWRFDRSFKKMSEESYSTDLFTHNLDCPYGCGFLKISTKYGFLVARPLSINYPSSHQKVFDIGGLFLLTKDGKVMRIYKLPYLGPLAVSPNGCKVSFVQRDSLEEVAHGQVVLIDVCSYLSKEEPH